MCMLSMSCAKMRPIPSKKSDCILNLERGLKSDTMQTTADFIQRNHITPCSLANEETLGSDTATDVSTII